MFSAIDLYQLEKKVGKEAANRLTNSLRGAVRYTTKPKVGLAMKSSASAKYKNNRLQRLVIQAPHYIFKQHYGFEGTKSNGVQMRLKQTFVIDIALTTSNVLESLADDIGNIRMEEVTTKINF